MKVLIRGTFMLCCLQMIFAADILAQDWGLCLGGASSKAMMLNLAFTTKAHNFYLGGTFQIKEPKGEERENLYSANSLVSSEKEDKFYSLDIAYGYTLFKKYELIAEFSVGRKKYYLNYDDSSLEKGGYHIVTKKEVVTGLGLGVGYHFSDIFSLFLGYNTLREVGGGFRVILK